MRALFIALALAFVAAPASATDWTYCKGKKAYKDKSHQKREKKNDWICNLKPDKHKERCPTVQETACKGGKRPGPHDVPNGGKAWFPAYSSDQDSMVRCKCGCFAKGTRILTHNGPVSIEELLGLAKYQSVDVRVRASARAASELENSRPLRTKHFTVGPEEKPLVVIHASNGQTLRLTGNHPVLTVTEGEQKMVRADELQTGDILLDRYGGEVSVSKISSELLPPEENDVINFASANPDPTSHVVVANSLQVGDNAWQKALDVMESREDLRKQKDLSYLDSILNDS